MCEELQFVRTHRFSPQILRNRFRFAIRSCHPLLTLEALPHFPGFLAAGGDAWVVSRKNLKGVNMSVRFTLCAQTFVLPLIASLLIGACSSGGSGGESSASPSGGFSEVSISQVKGPQQRYEGETVTLSVDAEGDVAENLRFAWTLSGDVEFQGQGTSAITFVAPEVNGISVISVRVKAGLKNGTLLGDGDRFASIQILDLDPLNILERGFQTTLPEVQALNFETLEDVDLLALSAFQVENFVSTGAPMNVQRIFRGAAEVEADSADFNVRLCGSLGLSPLRDLTDPNLECDSVTGSRKYYQSGAELRSEFYCGDEIIYAFNIRGVNVDPRSRQGQVIFNVEDSESLQDSMSACLERVDVLISRYDETRDSPMKYVSVEGSRYRIEVPQPAGPVVLEIVGDKIISSFATFDLSELFNESGAISATMFAPNHSELDGLEASDGSVKIFNLDEDEYEVEFDLYFDTENDSRMQIRGESILYLP